MKLTKMMQGIHPMNSAYYKYKNTWRWIGSIAFGVPHDRRWQFEWFYITLDNTHVQVILNNMEDLIELCLTNYERKEQYKLAVIKYNAAMVVSIKSLTTLMMR
jgi:hypothetical protein